MPYTPLDRQFRQWQDDRATIEDHRLFEQAFFGEVGWPELLKHQRVIVLAEAGSGKSIELEEQARALTAAGEYAFHATVKNVALYGLATAIGRLAAACLTEWQFGSQTAWFLIDSVDEAKLDHIRLREALTRLADDIGAGLPRARIILSGRYSNWEFCTDLDELERALPIAAVRPLLPETPGHPLIRLMREERNGQHRETVSDRPLVVLMAPLDRDRVRVFAGGLGITDIDAFLMGLDAHNLWSLAKRPLDLSWLIDYWRTHSRFGCFAEMLESSLRARLQEPDVSRANRDPIDGERALLALERIGAALGSVIA